MDGHRLFFSHSSAKAQWVGSVDATAESKASELFRFGARALAKFHIERKLRELGHRLLPENHAARCDSSSISICLRSSAAARTLLLVLYVLE